MRSIKALPLAALVAFAAACDQQPTEPLAARVPRDAVAPLLTAVPGKAIPGTYVVVLKDRNDPRSLAASVGATPRAAWTAALHGFAADLNQGQLNALLHDPRVKYVEEDQVFTASGTQYSAPWGLDRIDQRSRPTDGTYTYDATGSGVRAYVIDTGILTTHNEFGGRASVGGDFVGDGQNGVDCNGHGTHVAGIVGGGTYGVAKDVSLVAVRVLNCSGNGTTTGVISGINWVTSNRVLPAVANMSLGGAASQSVDDATNGLINAGVAVVVAAGNENQNACNVSPARVGAALTVGATSSNDARGVWNSTSASNYGSCLDLFAPGTAITSAWIGSNSATHSESGTSMASPHVAGVAAQYLEYHPTETPAQVTSAVVGNTTTNVVGSAGTGSPNRLLYSRIPLPVPNPSVASSGGYPVISWSSMLGVGSYSVTLITRRLYDDYADNIHTVYEDTEAIGTTTGTSIGDGTHPYTGSAGCILSAGMYTQDSVEYYYQVDANYSSGTVRSALVQAPVAPASECPQ